MAHPLYSRDVLIKSSSFSENGYLVEFCTDDFSSSSSVCSNRSSASTGKMWIQQELPKALVQRTTQCPPPQATAPWGVPRIRSENRQERSFISRNKPLSQEEIRIQKLVDRANQHQSYTARISDLRDFDNLTFTLPAAESYKDVKSTPVQTKKEALALSRESQDYMDIPIKAKCPLISLPISSEMEKPPRRGRGPMFRGKKAWTSSAAAVSMIAEARYVDRHYYFQSSPEIASSICPSVDKSDFDDSRRDRHIESTGRPLSKRWKSPFKRRSTPRSTLIYV